ncbi:helix-turn-helix domain-containing protein [Chelativorans xinjiangense]|uniref:helix-turn-helix domain-containing protein n=1 Tax=Chelativorans xinjiangense TaxID=2681485 RepID=UPI00135C16B1|nr:helix-turn-helix domain-containing protein [Chelativorans xinjiangense]
MNKDSGEAGFHRNRNEWVDYVLERDDLHPTIRLIGCWIARRINENTRDTWYQVSTIALKTGVSSRTVIRAVATLEGEELLFVRRDGQRGRQKAVNRYELLYPWL